MSVVTFKHYPVPRMFLASLLCLISFLIPFAPGLFQSVDSYGLASNRPAPGFQLLDASGSPRSLADFSGKYVYLMFGYLNCVDICHAEAITFQEIDRFADIDKEVVFLFITIDPERDDPARLSAYFDQRGENFVSLRGTDDRSMQALALAYNGYFYRQGGDENSPYAINHAGFYYLIDPDGRIRFTYSWSQRQLLSIVSDLKEIESEYNAEWSS